VFCPTLDKPCYQKLFGGCLAIAGIEASLLRLAECSVVTVGVEGSS
jgi:hypothetical protein